MEYQRVQRTSNWNPTFTKRESPSNDDPPKTVQRKTTPASPSEQSIVDRSPEPSDWVQQDPVMMRIMANNPVVRQILQPHGEQSVATTKGNTSTDAVAQESVQLKCADCTASDSVQVPENELQQDTVSVREVQKAAKDEKSSESKIQQVAATGFRGSAASLPHLNRIQQSFGVDLSGVQAYVGGDAAAACQRIGAQAYASGNQIAFKEQPSLELAAHEAAHIVQQRSGKVQLAGGVGQVGDKYENHADAVAAEVAAGRSAAPLLGEYANVNRSSDVQEKFRSLVQSKSTSCEAGEKDKPVMRFESFSQEQTKASSIAPLGLRPETAKDAEEMFQVTTPKSQANKEDWLNIGASDHTDSLLATSRTPRPARRPASFKHINLNGPINLGCGGFDWKVQWQVENQMPDEFGFVVQKVQMHLQKTSCISPINGGAETKTYWEAWPVFNDTVYQSLRGGAHTFDRFYVAPAPNHYGINAVQGNAKYIPNYEAPKTWGQGVEQAGGLLSTTSQPAGWSDSDTIVRHVINDFICCGDKQISQIKVGEGAFSSENQKKIQAGGSHRPYRLPAIGIPKIPIPEIPRIPIPSIPRIPNPRV